MLFVALENGGRVASNTTRGQDEQSLAYRFGQIFLHTKWINLNDKEKSVCLFIAVF